MPKPSDRLSSQPSWSRFAKESRSPCRPRPSASRRPGRASGGARASGPPSHSDLLLQDLVGVTRLARIEQQRTLLELGQGLGPARHRLDVHRVIGVEADVVESAEDRGVLVLAADRLLEDVDLDADRRAQPESAGRRLCPGGRRGR